MPRTSTSDVTAKAVGEEIRRARKQLALTQLELSRRLGTSQSYVANVEAGRENLTLGKLAQVAAALGTALEIRLPVVERARVAVADNQAVALDQPLRATRLQNRRPGPNSHLNRDGRSRASGEQLDR